MASRYDKGNLKKLNDGRIVYKSKLYPNIPLLDDDIYIVTQAGDRLDTLANQFFGDSSLWWIIASANNIHSAIFALSDGTQLRIPTDFTTIVNNFNN